MTKKKRDVTTIYVLRHGESQSNVYARENPDKPASHFGPLGSSLTQKGREQAHSIAKRLHHVQFDAIFSSELARAKETAEIIAAGRNLEVITNRAIRERSFGEHMSGNQKREIEKALVELDEKGKFAFKYFPHGESGLDVVERFEKFLKEIINEYKSKTILLVTHGYVMRSFLIYEKFAEFDELLGGSIKNWGYFVVESDENTYKMIDKYGISHRKGTDDEE